MMETTNAVIKPYGHQLESMKPDNHTYATTKIFDYYAAFHILKQQMKKNAPLQSPLECVSRI